MKRFLTIGLLAVLIFGIASVVTMKTAVYGPGCAEARQAQQRNRGINPIISNGVSMTGWPMVYVTINRNDDCKKATEVFWNTAGLGIDLMVSVGLGAMLYVVIDTLNDWRRPKRAATKR